MPEWLTTCQPVLMDTIKLRFIFVDIDLLVVLILHIPWFLQVLLCSILLVNFNVLIVLYTLIVLVLLLINGSLGYLHVVSHSDQGLILQINRRLLVSAIG